MFFAHRIKQRLRVALAACAVYALITAVLAAVLPREGHAFAASLGWWLCAIRIGLAAYAAVELFGNWSLERPFWQCMPSAARVLLLGALVSCVAEGAVFVSQFISNDGSL